MAFKKAVKLNAKLRLALIGPAGSGKTYTALSVAQYLGGKVALIDTEHGSASKYADLFSFDVLELDSFSPENYIKGIKEAQECGFDVLIIDSLSHAWSGKDGALELVDKAKMRSKSGNAFNAWGTVTPLQNQMVDTILGAKLHIICTLRSKMEYVQEQGPGGKTIIRKVGLQPVQRDGVEYEFDVVGDLDTDNTLAVGKTRCPALRGAVIPTPGKELAKTLVEWCTSGKEPPKEEPRPATNGVAPAVNGNGHHQPKPKEPTREDKIRFIDQRIRANKSTWHSGLTSEKALHLTIGDNWEEPADANAAVAATADLSEEQVNCLFALVGGRAAK